MQLLFFMEICCVNVVEKNPVLNSKKKFLYRD